MPGINLLTKEQIEAKYGSTVDTTPTENSTNLVTSGGVKTALDGKMSAMTVDSAPTENSTNLVTSGGVYSAIEAIVIRTILIVTVTDGTSQGNEVGRTVTATNGTDTRTATTDNDGVATIYLNSAGTYTVTSDAPAGYKSSKKTVSIEIGNVYTASIDLIFGWGKFGMSFDATTFQTDPTGCLVYTYDCAGYTPVSGPGNNTLAKCSTIGDWEMKSDGTSDNPLLNECFYATFNSSGVLHEKLNPQDLSQKIATWNNTTKEWESASGSSSISTENTMFCIPTLYFNSTESEITISSDPTTGTAYAHTIDGHIYDYLAIGVYEAVYTSSKLYSRMGFLPTRSKSRVEFRSYAQANTVQNGHAMLWNFYQWNLWRIMTIFAMKSFNGQSQIGNGGLNYDNSSVYPGVCNTLGPFAGNNSTSTGSAKSVKAFIENPWRYNSEFIDDVIYFSYSIYAGQHSQATDDYNQLSIIYTTYTTLSGYPAAISTDPISWGIGKNGSGSSTTGLCDFQSISSDNTTVKAFNVGYNSAEVTYPGPSYLGALSSTTYSSTALTTRLAFVFDIDSSEE